MLTFVSFALFLSLPSCSEDVEGIQDIAQQKEHDDNQDARDSQRDTCQNTRGRWHENLRSCICPESLIFDVSTGCRFVDDYVKIKSNRQMYAGQMKIFWPGNTSDIFTQQISNILRGWTIDTTAEEKNNITVFPSSDPDAAHAVFSSDILCSFPSARHWALSSDKNHSTFVPEISRLCRNLIPKNHPSVSSFDKMCDELGEAYRHAIFSDESIDWYYSQEESPDDSAGIWKAFIPTASRPVLMNIEVFRHTHTSRRLVAYRENRNRIRLELRPDGYILGGYIIMRHPAEGTEKYLAIQRTILFDENFVAIQETGDDLGLTKSTPCKETLLKQATEFDDAHLERAHENRQNSPVGLVLSEEDINFESTTVQRMLGLPQETQPMSFDVPVIGPTLAPAQHVMALAAAPSGSHGTAVLSVATKGIKGVRVNVINTDAIDSFRNPSEFHSAAQEVIDSVDARVYNISQSFSRDTTDCGLVFGKVIQDYEKKTLFVVAAESPNLVLSDRLCPSGLTLSHSNVVVVNRDLETSVLPEEMSAGGWVADLSAPAQARALGFMQDPEGATRELWSDRRGSSFSAAIVSNVALRIFSTYPWMTPEEVIDLLCRYSSGTSRVLRCGGMLDIDRLFADMEGAGRSE